jgi:hypothetical protein
MTAPNGTSSGNFVRWKQALYTFLVERFSGDEFRRWAELAFDIGGKIPGVDAAAEKLIGEGVEVLVRYGHVDVQFFVALRKERPRYQEEINSIERMWQTQREQATEGPTSTVKHAVATEPSTTVEAGAWDDQEKRTLAEQLGEVLRDAPALTGSLARRLAVDADAAGSLSKLHERVAGRIMVLSRGREAVCLLVEACWAAIAGPDAEAPGEREAARRLLTRWLPRAHGDVARTVVLRLTEQDPDCPNLEVRALSPLLAEVHLATANRRDAAFATRKVVVEGVDTPLVEGKGRLPTPSGGAEIVSGEQAAASVARSVVTRFNLERRATDVMQLVEARAHLKFLRRHGRAQQYLLLSGEDRRLRLTDATIAALNHMLPGLQVAVMMDEPDRPEAVPAYLQHDAELWRFLFEIFADSVD